MWLLILCVAWLRMSLRLPGPVMHQFTCLARWRFCSLYSLSIMTVTWICLVATKIDSSTAASAASDSAKTAALKLSNAVCVSVLVSGIDTKWVYSSLQPSQIDYIMSAINLHGNTTHASRLITCWSPARCQQSTPSGWQRWQQLHEMAHGPLHQHLLSLAVQSCCSWVWWW